MDIELERLREASFLDSALISKYINLYERTYGKLPILRPLLTAICTRHQSCRYDYPIESKKGDYHQWEVQPDYYSIKTSLINDMQLPYNLFNIKKNELPQISSPQELLKTFYSRIGGYFGFNFCQNFITYYYEHQLRDIVTIIDELQIPPKIPDYPLIPISLEETIELINLRIDLINYPYPTTDWLTRNDFSFCLENYFPLTIFAFSDIGGMEQYLLDRQNYGLRSRHLWRTSYHRGITFDAPSSDDRIARAELSIFG